MQWIFQPPIQIDLLVFECNNHKYEFFYLADKPIIMILSRPLAQCSDWDILSRLNFLLTAILFIRSCLQSGVITIWLLRRDLTPWRVSMRSAEKIIIKNYVLIETKNIHRKMFTPELKIIFSWFSVAPDFCLTDVRKWENLKWIDRPRIAASTLKEMYFHWISTDINQNFSGL